MVNGRYQRGRFGCSYSLYHVYCAWGGSTSNCYKKTTLLSTRGPRRARCVGENAQHIHTGHRFVCTWHTRTGAEGEAIWGGGRLRARPPSAHFGILHISGVCDLLSLLPPWLSPVLSPWDLASLRPSAPRFCCSFCWSLPVWFYSYLIYCKFY